MISGRFDIYEIPVASLARSVIEWIHISQCCKPLGNLACVPTRLQFTIKRGTANIIGAVLESCSALKAANRSFFFLPPLNGSVRSISPTFLPLSSEEEIPCGALVQGHVPSTCYREPGRKEDDEDRFQESKRFPGTCRPQPTLKLQRQIRPMVFFLSASLSPPSSPLLYLRTGICTPRNPAIP